MDHLPMSWLVNGGIQLVNRYFGQRDKLSTKKILLIVTKIRGEKYRCKNSAHMAYNLVYSPSNYDSYENPQSPKMMPHFLHTRAIRVFNNFHASLRSSYTLIVFPPKLHSIEITVLFNFRQQTLSLVNLCTSMHIKFMGTHLRKYSGGIPRMPKSVSSL